MKDRNITNLIPFCSVEWLTFNNYLKFKSNFFADYIYLENILEIKILSENILKDSFQRLN